MAAYRVLALDTVTGTPVAELPVAGLSYGSVLNGAGELSADLPMPPLDSARGRELAAVFNDAATEVRRQLVVERDGVPVWAGPIWASPYQDDRPTRSLRAAEWWSYFRRRCILITRNFAQEDQLEIARTLLEDALLTSSTFGLDMGFGIDSGTSGVDRDRQYLAYERKELGEAIEQLAAVDDGFDFAVDIGWSGAGALTKQIRLQYPRRGRPFEWTGLTFEIGRNVTDFSWPSDGTRYANVVHASGSGDGPLALRSTLAAWGEFQPPDIGGLGMPIIETTESRSDVIVQATLDGIARAQLAAKARPVVIPEITVRAESPAFGSYQCGDSCRVLIQPGVSPRFPDGLDTLLRIIGWDVDVSDEGTEQVKLTLGEDI